MSAIRKRPTAARSPASKRHGATKSGGTKAARAQSVRAKAPRSPKAARAKTPATKRSPPAKPSSARSAKRPGETTGAKEPAPLPKSLVELMTQALTMEIESAQRYTDFADAMEIHNNREVAALFRKMADIETRHAQQIMLQMRWTSMPPPISGSWEGYEPPESAAADEVHYLMQPYHALEIALANEERAERFFAKLASTTASAPVRKAARGLQAEEREHVRLVREWMKKVPPPDDEWANDPDPPVYTD